METEIKLRKNELIKLPVSTPSCAGCVFVNMYDDCCKFEPGSPKWKDIKIRRVFEATRDVASLTQCVGGIGDRKRSYIYVYDNPNE